MKFLYFLIEISLIFPFCCNAMHSKDSLNKESFPFSIETYDASSFPAFCSPISLDHFQQTLPDIVTFRNKIGDNNEKLFHNFCKILGKNNYAYRYSYNPPCPAYVGIAYQFSKISAEKFREGSFSIFDLATAEVKEWGHYMIITAEDVSTKKQSQCAQVFYDTRLTDQATSMNTSFIQILSQQKIDTIITGNFNDLSEHYRAQTRTLFEKSGYKYFISPLNNVLFVKRI